MARPAALHPVREPRDPTGLRIAAIDIGTNSIHMVIARATGPNDFEVVDREREVVQIGRGSFGDGRLRAEAMRRTIDALARYAELARRNQVDHILCTATAAAREAKNGGEFVRAARAASGVQPRVIPYEEEARLIYLGVRSALQLESEPALIVDIGGGSVQLAVGDRDRLHRTTGARLGALRLTETLLDSDPPSRRDLARLRRHIRRESKEMLETVEALGPKRVIGSSGSIHALAQAAHWADHGGPVRQINGHLLPRESLERLSRRLQRMTLAEREQVPGMDAPRAEIIVPAALLLLHVLESLKAPGITLSDFGVREGLVVDYLQSHAREVTTVEQAAGVRLRSVLALLAKFLPNTRHSEHVAKLALELFDGLKSVHRLGPHERELLHYGALLHDVGAVIGYDDHAAHSYYVIRNGQLRGLSAAEVAIVANVARFHSKTKPRKSHEGFGDLSRDERRTVRWLAAIVRIAEGFDRSHYQLIRDLRVARRGDRVSIFADARRDARLELWGARRRAGLLEELIEGRVRISREKRAEQRAAREAPPTRRVAGGRRG